MQPSAPGGNRAALAGLLSEIKINRAHSDQIDARDALYRRTLAVADVTAALLALLVSAVMIGGHGLSWWALALAPFVVVVAKVIGVYDHDNLVLRKYTLDEAPALFQMATLYTLVVWLGDGTLLAHGTLSHVEAVALGASSFAFLLFFRAAGRLLLRRLMPAERCMLIGDVTTWSKLQQSLAHRPDAELVSWLSLRTAENGRGQSLNVEMTGALSRLRAQVERDKVHRVIIALRESGFDEILDCIFLLKRLGVKVSVVPRLLEVVGSAVEFEDIDGMPVLGIRNFGLTRSSGLIKRSFDLVVAGLGVVVTTPLLVLIAAAIKLSTRGPVLFRQLRVGRDGSVFEMYKFRTMHNGADLLQDELAEQNATEGLFKVPEDPRVTRVGRWLRHSSLDELPQLINVVKGDMSLVGPRPLVLEEDRKVQGWARRRLHLTPGMTGNWQTLGATRVPLHEMVKIDYLYIANWSLWGDIKAMVRTLPHVIGRRGL